MKSGMLAAEAAFKALGHQDSSTDEVTPPVDMSSYEEALKKSWIWKELHQVRNVRPSFNTQLGIWGGIAYSGLDTLILKGRTPWTFRNRASDASHTRHSR